MLRKVLVVIFMLGFVSTIVGFVLTKGDFKMLSKAINVDVDYEYKEYTSCEDFSKINTDLSSNNILFHKSLDNKLVIQYYESEKDKVNINIKDGILTITSDYKKPKTVFNIRIKSSKVSTINIYLPNDFYDEANIQLTHGNIILKSFTFNNLKVEIVSGNVTLENIKTNNNMDLQLTSGNLKVESAQVENKVTIRGVSGNFVVKNMTSKSTSVTSTSGNIELINLTSNIIETRNTSGNIKVEIKGNKEDYKADLAITTGIITYDGLRISSQVINPLKEKYIIAHAVSGKININFKD